MFKQVAFDSHGWMRFAHFDGSVYYYNTNRRIATPDDITQPETYEKYRTYVNNVMRRLAAHPVYAECSKDWETMVVQGLTEDATPTVFALSYSMGSYIELRATAPEDEPPRMSHTARPNAQHTH